MSLEDRKLEIESRWGSWTAHNIQLTDTIYTIAPDHHFNTLKRASVYSSIVNHLRYSKNNPLSKLKVLDLGCLEGGISIHFAQHGSITHGVDVRESNLKKSIFVAEELQLSNSTWQLADVTDQDFWSSILSFDLIICSGLLYHIDAPGIPKLISNIYDHLEPGGIAIVDTNITSKVESNYFVDTNLQLYGRYYEEFNSCVSSSDREKSNWSSFNNDRSFWLTERSLTNLLNYSGFSFVARALYPYHEWSHINRDIWYAIKSEMYVDQPLKTEPDTRMLEHPTFSQE